MKRILSIILTGIMIISLASCGGGRADEAYVGNWVSVSGEAMGVTLTGEDISGFGIELKAGGKGTMTVEGDPANIKWTNDETTLTVTVEGENLIANISEDTLVFTDFMGLGMDLTFAKEGTAAANSENFLPENEKAILGTWVSNKVTDVLEEDASGIMPADALKLTINGDRTADIELDGETYSAQKWSMMDTFGFLDEGSAIDLSWDVEGEELKVTYNGEEYLVFSCTKQ